MAQHPDSIFDAVLATFKELGVVRPRDLAERNLPRKALQRLLKRGDVVRVGRGLYTLADAPPSEQLALVEATRRVPHGVVCLLSALRVHELTTQEPFEVWLAIGSTARQPKLDRPPLRIVRMSDAALDAGVEAHLIEGVRVPVFRVAKTVADCFKYRRKVGLDVAIEALRETIEQRRASLDELWDMAKLCRVTSIMTPYLQALA